MVRNSNFFGFEISFLKSSINEPLKKFKTLEKRKSKEFERMKARVVRRLNLKLELLPYKLGPGRLDGILFLCLC